MALSQVNHRQSEARRMQAVGVAARRVGGRGLGPSNSRASVAGPSTLALRAFTSTSTAPAEGQQTPVRASTLSVESALAALDSAPPRGSSSPARQSWLSKTSPARAQDPFYREGDGRKDRGGRPYKLHAHCRKHNTILTLTRDNPDIGTLRGTFKTLQEGGDVSEFDPALYGQTVAKTSCGAMGFKKAGRGTFEAATRTSLRMFELIENLGKLERKTKHGSRVKDDTASGLEIVFKGYGAGREALNAALATAQGERIRKLTRRVTDATPLRIGGTRPRKRRKLAPPLDLSPRRKGR